MGKRLTPKSVLELELASLKKDKQNLEEDLVEVEKLIEKYEKIVKILNNN